MDRVKIAKVSLRSLVPFHPRRHSIKMLSKVADREGLSGGRGGSEQEHERQRGNAGREEATERY